MIEAPLQKKLDYCKRSGNPYARYGILSEDELRQLGEEDEAIPLRAPRVEYARSSAREVLTKLWSLSGKPDSGILEFIRSAPKRIAEEVLGVAVRFQPDFEWTRKQEGVEHEIAGYADRDARVIGIVNTHSPECQRFTLAHELAHLMLHPAGVKFRDPPISAYEALTAIRNPEEREANIFATELLMPERRVEMEFQSAFPRVLDLITDSAFIVEAGQMSKVANLTPSKYAALDVNAKASVVAQITVVSGRHFQSMADRFQVSSIAMGIRLKELGLVLENGRRAS